MTDATTGDTPMTAPSVVCTRAHASFLPTWQRFNVVHHPTASSLSASARNTPAQQQRGSNGQGAQQQQQQQHPYNKQYSHVYSRRLAELRRRCGHGDNGNGGDDTAVAVSRIIELGEGTRSTIVGTFAKTCAGRPPAATDAPPTSSAEATPLRLSYCDRENDSLVLEDESGRVELTLTSGCVDGDGNHMGIDAIATGVVAAVTGTVPRDGNGVMEVDRVAFPSMPKPKRFKVPSKTRGGRGHEEEKKADEGGGGDGDVVVLRNALDADGTEIPGSSPCVLLVSGLNCGSTAHDNDDGGTTGTTNLGLRTDMLADFVSGNLPGMERRGARIARVIVAGGSVGAASPVPLKPKTSSANKRNSSSAEAEAAAFPVRELDLILNSFVSSGVPVDLMPGARDPTNANWPQQPVHRCLLPNSSSGTSGPLLRRTPNPYEATLGEKQFLGTDGRNVSDLSRYLSSSSSPSPPPDEDGEGGEKGRHKHKQRPMTELEVLEMTLRYGHVCPTAPDSLPSFPGFVDADPFVLRDLPGVYFAGNCDGFATKLVDVAASDNDDDDGVGGKCRLICVPSFAKTSTAVLVNLETLEVEPIRFED